MIFAKYPDTLPLNRIKKMQNTPIHLFLCIALCAAVSWHQKGIISPYGVILCKRGCRQAIGCKRVSFSTDDLTCGYIFDGEGGFDEEQDYTKSVIQVLSATLKDCTQYSRILVSRNNATICRTPEIESITRPKTSFQVTLHARHIIKTLKDNNVQEWSYSTKRTETKTKRGNLQMSEQLDKQITGRGNLSTPPGTRISHRNGNLPMLTDKQMKRKMSKMIVDKNSKSSKSQMREESNRSKSIVPGGKQRKKSKSQRLEGKQSDRSKSTKLEGKQSDISKSTKLEGRQSNRSKSTKLEGRQSDISKSTKLEGKQSNRSKSTKLEGKQSDRGKSTKLEGKQNNRSKSTKLEGKQSNRGKSTKLEGRQSNRGKSTKLEGKQSNRGKSTKLEGKQSDRGKSTKLEGRQSNRGKSTKLEGKQSDIGKSQVDSFTMGAYMQSERRKLSNKTDTLTKKNRKTKRIFSQFLILPMTKTPEQPRKLTFDTQKLEIYYWIIEMQITAAVYNRHLKKIYVAHDSGKEVFSVPYEGAEKTTLLFDINVYSMAIDEKRDYVFISSSRNCLGRLKGTSYKRLIGCYYKYISMALDTDEQLVYSLNDEGTLYRCSYDGIQTVFDEGAKLVAIDNDIGLVYLIWSHNSAYNYKLIIQKGTHTKEFDCFCDNPKQIVAHDGRLYLINSTKLFGVIVELDVSTGKMLDKLSLPYNGCVIPL